MTDDTRRGAPVDAWSWYGGGMVHGLSPEQLRYVNAQPVVRLATVREDGSPHVVALCHAATQSAIYTSNVPDGRGNEPHRVAHVQHNARVTLVADHYSEDWEHIGYVLVFGWGEILYSGAEYQQAVRMLRERYPQAADWPLDEWSVLALIVERTVAWGDLSAGLSRW